MIMVDTSVMVVEDEFIVAEDLRAQLNRLGYQITALVSTGEEAVLKVEENRPDVVLMDISLAGDIDGVEAADIIRTRFQVPVIFLTAYANDDMIERAKITEPLGYMVKPFETREIKAAIETAVYNAALKKKLAESEQRFRTFADFTYDWESWVDQDGKHIYTSPSCKRITGYGPDFFTNIHNALKIVHPGDKDKVKQFLKFYSSSNDIITFDFRIIRPDGEIRWINNYSQPVFGENGEPRGRRISNRDITEQKMHQAERERLINELQEALSRVRQLSGLLPICSSCKKIRDDQGYWQQIEMYIQEHSEAEFSHSICPECARKLYPEIYEKVYKSDAGD